uniref:POM121 transmembrane nucleoporin n=1 Tax=Salarias fasciatus TaxID=181472 RepID=A0A672HKZ8_SALFA
MRVVRRRAAAMSPKEKRLLLLAALTLFFLTFYYAPSFLYATLILAACCAACFYHSREPLPARLGQKPRAGLSVPAALRRWLWGSGVSGAPVAAAGRTKSGANRAELREAGGLSRNRGGIHRREVQPGGSFYFSPQDFLMGSYIGKHDSPTAETGRPRAVRNPREQLRERLSRPNHAVPTPIRRLSFAGEPVGTVGRFTITPQRHYPLQQPGVSSVGVLPPVKWDGFSKKNVLSPRNSSAALSPVTVKIARPDHSTPSMEHLSCAGLSRPPADPCSRESVLRVLRESRKRDVEEEDRSFVADQRSKRRRNDSGGSAHSAFEPLLPNGTPSQLVPKPGSLKRGLASLADESIMKRSRTSSISSGSGAHAPRGTLGSRRNAIQSSYSSSLGLGQWKRPSAPSSPLSSPGSSRCQTPEGSSKRPREDDGQSPSSASSVRSDHTASDKAPTTSKVTPAPSVPVLTSSASAGSGGKRKRKIPLVSSLRDDQISLPPPPELGYTITVKDLDEEKKAGISKIQKVLETPAPEPEKPASPPATTSTPAAASTTAAAAAASSSSITLSSLLAAPLPTNSSSTIPVINLDPSPGSSSSSAAANPLLEALKMKIIPPASSTPSTSTTAVSASTTPAPPSSSALNPSTASEPPQPPPAGAEKPSAFAQVLSQASKAAASSSSPAAAGGSLFGITPQISAAAASSASNPVTASASASSTNPLLPSGFKPIFSVNTTSSSSATSTSESTTAAPTFKPVFGDAPGGRRLRAAVVDHEHRRRDYSPLEHRGLHVRRVHKQQHRRAVSVRRADQPPRRHALRGLRRHHAAHRRAYCQVSLWSLVRAFLHQQQQRSVGPGSKRREHVPVWSCLHHHHLLIGSSRRRPHRRCRPRPRCCRRHVLQPGPLHVRCHTAGPSGRRSEGVCLRPDGTRRQHDHGFLWRLRHGQLHLHRRRHRHAVHHRLWKDAVRRSRRLVDVRLSSSAAETLHLWEQRRGIHACA